MRTRLSTTGRCPVILRLVCYIRSVSNVRGHSFSRSHSIHTQPKQVLYFQNTDETDMTFTCPYQTVSHVKDFGIQTIRRGFQRRPELIRQRQPDSVRPYGTRLVDNLSFGLYGKSERIQLELTQAILELMGYRAKGGIGQLVLDIGCGCGYSLQPLVGEGVCVTGIDMDLHALSEVQKKTDCGYFPAGAMHVIRLNISRGLCFREDIFDWAFSVSFLQWLCAARHSVKILRMFFQYLSAVLKPCAGAGIQFYPQNPVDVERVIDAAQLCFKGALVSDYPHLDRGRKLFLILENNK